jgi:hypothetical protein
MSKFFKVNGACAYVLILSLISGFPSNAKFTKELYDQKLIDDEEGTKILLFTHFSNPLFILGTVAILFLNNKEIGFLILICHYFGNFILGLLFRNSFVTNTPYEKGSLRRGLIMMNKKRINNTQSFGEMIGTSLMSTINTLLMILGVVTIFLVFTTLVSHLINVGNYNQSIINGFIEMTQGLKYVSTLEIPLKLKAILSVMILSFGGFSVHVQAFSILSSTKIKYLPFLTARLLHAFISSFLVYLIFDIWLFFI